VDYIVSFYTKNRTFVLINRGVLVLAVVYIGKKYKHGKQSGKSIAHRQDPAHPQDRSYPQGCQSRGVRSDQKHSLSIKASALWHSTKCCVCCRVVEDYGVIYLGSPVFKIARLLFVAMFSVHLFACIFFRVKVSSASKPEDVAIFYTSKNVPDNVSNDLTEHYIS
jgi:hypothetical protein